MQKITLFIFLIAVLFQACKAEKGQAISSEKKEPNTTLVIVRHAEKMNKTDTSSLTTEGLERAKNLQVLLQNTDLSRIYTTPFKRMRMTAQPTARNHQLEINDYPAGKIEAIENIIKENKGKTVLLVGHSNTIPAILNHYLGTQKKDLDNYNSIFILTIKGQKEDNQLLELYF